MFVLVLSFYQLMVFVVAAPHSLPYSTCLLPFAGPLFTGDRPSVTHTQALAVSVGVEFLIRRNVLAIKAATALSQWHTAFLEGQSQRSGQPHISAVPAVTSLQCSLQPLHVQ